MGVRTPLFWLYSNIKSITLRLSLVDGTFWYIFTIWKYYIGLTFKTPHSLTRPTNFLCSIFKNFFVYLFLPQPFFKDYIIPIRTFLNQIFFNIVTWKKLFNPFPTRTMTTCFSIVPAHKHIVLIFSNFKHQKRAESGKSIPFVWLKGVIYWERCGFLFYSN